MTEIPLGKPYWPGDLLTPLDWVRYQWGLGANPSTVLVPTALHMKQIMDDRMDQLLGKKPMASRPHYMIGTITHTFCLEPETAFNNLIVMPATVADAHWRSDLRQNWYAACLLKKSEDWPKPLAIDDFKNLALAKGLSVLTQEEFQQVAGMVNAILTKDCKPFGKLEKLFAQAQTEQAAFREREIEWVEEPVRTKGRLDLVPSGNIIADIKTTADYADRDRFERAIWNYDYHAKMAFYLDTLNLLGFQKEVALLIAVEKEAPHGVCVYQLDQDALAAGRKLYQEKLRLWESARKAGVFPGYPDEVVPISLPAWALRKQSV